MATEKTTTDRMEEVSRAPGKAQERPAGQKALVIRAGGLGDFVLTIPLLKALSRHYQEVILATRRSFWELIAGDGLAQGFIDSDSSLFASLYAEPAAALTRYFAGAQVFSFWPDPDGILAKAVTAIGAVRLVCLQSRPTAPPHVTLRMFTDAGIAPPPGLLTTPSLCSVPVPGKALWLHPSSGAAAKNIPLSCFTNRARQWLTANPGGTIIVSLGEADRDLTGPARQAFAGLPIEWLIEPTLPELRRRLATQAGLFIGNDSGVTHLAAALGVPVEVFYRTTSPEVWAPLGERIIIQCR